MTIFKDYFKDYYARAPYQIGFIGVTVDGSTYFAAFNPTIKTVQEAVAERKWHTSTTKDHTGFLPDVCTVWMVPVPKDVTDSDVGEQWLLKRWEWFLEREAMVRLSRFNKAVNELAEEGA